MKTLIRNCVVWDGSGAAPFAAEVLVEGERIAGVARGAAALPAEGARVIDAQGMTLMPGLVEGHAHLSFCGAQRNTDLGDIPPEEHMIATHAQREDAARRRLHQRLQRGQRQAASRRGGAQRDRFGPHPGPAHPRGEPEITVTGGLGDDNRQHMMRDSFGLVADGPEAIAARCAPCIREGVDNIKLNISGDDFVPAKGGMTVMREEEVRIACEVAHDFGRSVASHSRASNAVQARGAVRRRRDLPLRVCRQRSARPVSKRCATASSSARRSG